MSNSQKIILGILSILACFLSISIIHFATQSYLAWTSQPLGPALDYPTLWQLPATWTPTPSTLLPTLTIAPTLNFETETPSSPFLPCTNLPTMNILAIGTDSRSDEYRYGRADVIRVVRADFRGQRVTVLEYPRDLWVKIPEVKDNLGTDWQKLNTSYTYGNPGLHYWDHPSQGPGLLARTLDLNFGMKVDHYIAANMNIFVDVVDALGGLEITLPEGVDGRTSYDRSQRLVFLAGTQRLTGEQALTLARIRNVSVFQRASNQNLVVCALQRQIRSPEVIPQIPAIIDTVIKNIQTDLTPEQISQLACLATTIPRSNIIFTEFPLELFHNDTVYDPIAKLDVFVWDADFEILRDYVSEFEAGTWPVASPYATPEPGISSCE